LRPVNPGNNFDGIVSIISKPMSQIKPYYYSNNVVIYNNDCLEILSNVPDNSIKPGDVILDPFNGGGTTGIASLNITEKLKHKSTTPPY
jgi:hypothetical protein